MKTNFGTALLILYQINVLTSTASASVLYLTEHNFTNVLESTKLAFVNFYADWCRYSQALTPILDETEKLLRMDFPDEKQFMLAKVDCEVETGLAKLFGVIKFPTMKIYRYGRIQRREYRGQRSVETIANFVRAQMTDSVLNLEAPVEDSALPLEPGEGAMVGRFANKDSSNYRLFSQLAEQTRDECPFIAVIGEGTGPDKVVFQKGTDPTTQVPVSTIDSLTLRSVVEHRCISIVRELTYENAEEMTEEGNPLFILFYRADDTAIVDKYKDVVEKHLKQYIDKVNFLYGQGPLFIRALRQLRKTVNDLPVLAIDSFQHMYIFPLDTRETLAFSPQRLGPFIEDLLSGKLHTEYHKTEGGEKGVASMVTEPPVSVFRRLGPSGSRYSFSKEEL